MNVLPRLASRGPEEREQQGGRRPGQQAPGPSDSGPIPRRGCYSRPASVTPFKCYIPPHAHTLPVDARRGWVLNRWEGGAPVAGYVAYLYSVVS
jgi:hypothetical protein